MPVIIRRPRARHHNCCCCDGSDCWCGSSFLSKRSTWRVCAASNAQDMPILPSSLCRVWHPREVVGQRHKYLVTFYWSLEAMQPWEGWPCTPFERVPGIGLTRLS